MEILLPAFLAILFGFVFIYYGNYDCPTKTNAKLKTMAFAITVLVFLAVYLLSNGVPNAIIDIALVFLVGFIAGIVTVAAHLLLVIAFRHPCKSAELLSKGLLALVLLVDIGAICISPAIPNSLMAIYLLMIILILAPLTCVTFIILKGIKADCRPVGTGN